MTEYKKLCEKRTAISLQKIIDATQTPAGFKDIVRITGMNESGIRTLILRNMQHFKFLGKQSIDGSRMMNIYQAAAADAQSQILGQAIYHNKYSQLTGEVDYIPSQNGQSHTATLVHNLRASQKSARTFVSGSSLA